MKKIIAFLSAACLIAVLGFFVCRQEEGKPLLIVGTAASFNPVLDELEAVFEKKHPDVDVRFHTGGSGMIARQVEAHAPIDVVMLASKKEADSLEQQRLIEMKDPAGFLRNRLVVVESKQSQHHWPNVKTMVVGTPGAVPVGTYAEQALEKTEWDGARIYAKDASSVLMWVSSGEADAGIVYETDANSSAGVRTVYIFPSNMHDSIVYNAGVVAHSVHSKAAAFESFLTSAEAMSVFKKYGFQPSGGGANDVY